LLFLFKVVNFLSKKVFSLFEILLHFFIAFLVHGIKKRVDLAVDIEELGLLVAKLNRNVHI